MQPKLSLCGLALLQMFFSFSQEESTTVSETFLEEVVVVDSRFKIKRSQSGKTVIKISEKEVKNFRGRSLAELLQTYGGISVIGNRSAAGQNLGLSIRGGRNNQVLILIDGVRVSDPSRIENDFDLNFLNLADIVSIEIVKGAASTLYGSSASTGVVNITTKKSNKELKIDLGTVFGNQNTPKTSFDKISYLSNFATFSGAKNKFQYKLNLANQRINGLSSVKVGTEVDEFTRSNYGLQLGRNGKSFDWNVTYSKDHIVSDYDNAFPVEDADFVFTTDLERFSWSSTYSHQYGSLQAVVGLQNTDRKYESSYPSSSEATNLAVDVFNKFIFKDRFYTILGYAHQLSSFEGVPSNSQNDVYFNLVYLSPEGINFNIGSRLNNHQVYGSHLTYSINPSYSFLLSNENRLKIISSFSSAFIPPSLYQLYDSFSGNNDLEPEVNTTLELGFEWSNYDNARASLLAFKRTEDPTLIYDYATYKYGNSNERISYAGLEFDYKNKLFDTVDIRLNYTYNETTQGNLIYLPKQVFGTVLDYDLNQYTHFNTSIQHIGPRSSLGGSKLDAYTLVDLKIDYIFKNQKLSTFFILANVLDTEFVEIENYSTQGRSFRLGLNFSF
ncbi:TonB-dependent receptor [Flavobacteriaceae bacterium]|nr:TonB-dependent receptor [Flavobacteriaceae bacterium]